MVKEVYDVVIIGAGPAGISASLYTKRAGKDTLVLYYGKSSLEKTERIENYYGFADGISGADLYNDGIEQAKNIGVVVRNEEILNIEKKEDNTFQVTTPTNRYKAKAVIIAVGQKRKELEVEGTAKFEGKGVSYCAICDGFFYRNKNVVLIGSGDYAISEANDLINLVNKITILTNGQKAPDIRDDRVEIITKNVKEISGKDKVDGVILEDDTKIQADGVFIAQGGNGPIAIAKKMGLIIKDNKISVNEYMQTNINGVYACGDCTEGLLQICKAVYDGAKAGLEVINFLNSNKI